MYGTCVHVHCTHVGAYKRQRRPGAEQIDTDRQKLEPERSYLRHKEMCMRLSRVKTAEN